MAAAGRIPSVPERVTSAQIAIEGWVTDKQGAPITAARVRFEGAQATSDAGGYFAFTAEQFDQPAAGSATDLDFTVAASGYSPWTIKGARYYPGDILRLYPHLDGADKAATTVKAAISTQRPIVGSFLPSYRAAGPQVIAAQANPLSATSAPQNPPAQIRVYRTGTGAVEVVPFKDYVKHVLPSEWIPTWAPGSLRAGAMAVKEYAWYWISLGGKQTTLGADVKDNTEDQVYDPNVSYASTDAAVDATWQYSMTLDGALIQANYCAGSYAADPTGDCPWGGLRYMTQWGSAFYADQGRSWSWILKFYYSGIVISPTPPGGDDGGPIPTRPPAPPAPTRPPAPAADLNFAVGQGAVDPAIFQAAYDRNGGAAVLGKPTGAVRWWLTYVSENNVMAQAFSGPQGGGNVWLVFDTLKSDVSGVKRAYMLSGEIAAAYANHGPVGPEWIGAPTSDPYTASPTTGGYVSQGFAKGTLSLNGSAVQFTPWAQQFSGWEARYFSGKPPEAVQSAPTLDLPGQPAIILDVATPNMNWPQDSGIASTVGAGTGDWSAQFTSSVTNEPGSYDVSLYVEGGVRLWVDGLLAVNAWSNSGPHTETYNIDLDGSPHQFRLQYYTPSNGATLSFTLAKRRTQPPPAPKIAPPDSGAGNASLRAKVRWLGKAASPNDTWAQPLTLMLSVPGDPTVVGTYQATTDRNGVVIYSNLPAGTYDVHVKGTHSIQSARASIVLADNRTADVDMKAQIEGDVDGDNCVTVNDFSIVQAMIGASSSTPGFDPAADLNGDGLVTVTDVSLLRSGFDMCGDISADNDISAFAVDGAPSMAQALAPWLNPDALQRDLSISLSASNVAPRVGDTIEVAVVANTGSQAVDGAAFILKYDPSKLVPVDASGNPTAASEPGLALPSVLGNWIDAQGGSIGYSAAMLQEASPSGAVVLTTVRFRVQQAGTVNLSFESVPSAHMQITNGGTNLLSKATGVTLQVAP
ncbi:MAG: SpoIID/LytB domain-containing protein [Chloroflexota bacterium]